MYNCFNCGYKTGFRPDGILGQKMLELLKALGVPEPEANRLKIESIRSRDANEHAEFKPYKPSFDWSEVLLPEESKPLDENTDPSILAYLQSRGSGIYENWNYYWSSS